MDCKDALPLIEADVDGELDLVRHVELAAHLKTCPACQAHFEAARARRDAISSKLTRHAAPSALRDRIRAQLPAPVAEFPVTKSRSGWKATQLIALGAAAALAIVLSYNLGQTNARRRAMFEDVVADHVRSLQDKHLTDVISTDQHTVKPWFAGKLDFSPPVVDLVAKGFPLIGGRLEYLSGQTAAAVVFRRHQHAINLFIWRSNGTELHAASEDRLGYRTVSWSQSGLNLIAVSEIPMTELEEFVGDFQTATK